MTDDLHTFIEPELQVRITAMVLGEASEFECDELEKLITEKPELAIYRRRLQAIHHLLDETVCPQRDSEWQLSEDKRERLRRTFANGNQSATPHKEQSTAHVQWRAAMGIAACLFVCLVIFSMMVPLAKRADMAYEGLDIKGGLDLGSEFQTTNEQSIPRTSELPVAGKLFDDKRRQTESAKKRPSVRSAVTGRGIASVNVPAPKKPSIPKPEVGFGNGDDFGDGFAGGDHGGDDADDDGVDPFAASEEEEVAEVEVDGEKAANQDKVVRREIPTRPSSGLAGEIPVGGKAYKSKQRGEEVLERSREAFKSEKSKGSIAGYVRPNDELGVSFGLTNPTNRPHQEHQDGRLHYYWRQNATATGTLGEGEDAKHDKGRDAFLAGGTVGNVNSRTATDFIHPSQGGQVSGASIATRNGKQVSDIATAGLRSGDFATTRSSIDAILNNPNRTKGKDISGIASVNGLLSDGQLALKKEKENTEYDEDAGFLSGGMGGGGAATTNDKKPLGLYDIPASEGVQRDSSLRWHAGVSMGYDDGKGVDKDKSGFGKDSGIDTSSIAHKEIARRTRLVSESDQAFLEGREADAKKDYEEAARQYRKAGDLLPAGPAVEDRRHAIAGRLGDANAALAKKYRQEGKYAEARKTLEDTLRHDPTNEIAKKQLEYLSDPLRTGEPAHDQTKREVAEIRKGLYMGEGYYNLGKYDEAEAEMKKVLQKDPYNKAARRWLEKVAATKSDYYRAAYDETRAKLLAEVDKAWELSEAPQDAPRLITKPEGESKPVPDGSKLSRIELELKKQSADVADKRRKLMEVAGKVGVVWAESEQGGQTIGGELELRQLAEKQLYEAERERDQLEHQINQLLKVKDGNISKLAAELPDVGFRGNYNQLNKALKELQVAKSSGFSSNHPDVIKHEARVNALKKSLEGRAKNLRASLKHRLDILNGRVNKMREVRDQQQDKETDKVHAFQEFNRLRKDYETAQRIKDQMQIRYDIEKTRAAARGEIVKPYEKENRILSPLRPKALPEETVTSNEPFSTFSLNVNDVSFKLARVALLEKGQWPEAAKVRTEEFVNAFDYGDPSPRRGDRVACAVEQSAHPFLQQRNLLRVGMKTAAMGRSQPLRLTVLLDNSGSMERADREASVLAAIQVLAAQLGSQDVITVVGFARQPRLLADRVRGDQAGKLVELVAKTPSEGGTNIEEALRLARTLAKRQHVNGAQSRVVLITDGVANLGNTIPEELAREVETMRQQGIAFDACGVGAEGLNDDILESLTRKGDGRYYFLNRPEDADAGFARQLAGALTPAAKNVKVQVVFNPQRVSRYRLLGFKKHRLKKEDFRNDKVDAAEMAAEEAGNAVYQIQVNPEGEGELGEVFVRFLDASTGRMVERSWPLPYEPQAKPFDMAAPSMQLAGTAAMLGEKLHGTDAGSVRFSMIADTLGKLRAHYASDPKVQDLIRMCRKVK